MKRQIFDNRDVFISLCLFILTLVPRSWGLNIFSTADEAFWLGCSSQFLQAVTQLNWSNTLGCIGHPGITTQWSGALGLWVHYLSRIITEKLLTGTATLSLSEAYQPSLDILAFARFPIVVVTTLFVVAVYVILKRPLGRRTALLAALLLAFDPFFVALSRSLLTDGLHASFALLSILYLGLALGSGRWLGYLLSGMSAGLATLSKSPAVFALGPLVMLLSLSVSLLHPGKLGTWRAVLSRLAIWYVALGLCVFILWPSMWVQPVRSLQFVFDNLTEVAISGKWRTETGPLFYPAVLLFRGSPLTIFGVLSALVLLGNWAKRVTRRMPITQTDIWILSLCGMVVTYVLMFSLGSWKNDFYMLPACLALDVLGAIGLIAALQTIAKSRPHSSEQRHLLNLSASVIVVSQMTLCLYYYPYYFSYYNPVLGGGRVARDLIPAAVGHGEGLERMVDYFNSKENVNSLWVGMEITGFNGCVSLKDFKGNIARFPPRRQINLVKFPYGQLDYIVRYISYSRRPLPHPFNELVDVHNPEFVVEEKGIPYVWVYRLPKKKLYTLPSHVTPSNVQYENGLKFLGHEIRPVMWDEATGVQLLPVTVYWQAENYCDRKHQVVFKLRDASYTIWGYEVLPSPCITLLDSSQSGSIFASDFAIEVLPATPPGVYDLEMILVQNQTGKEILPVAEAIPIDVLDSVEIPARPGLAVSSLDMEHEVNAMFLDRIQLLGYNVSGGTKRGEKLNVTLFWKCLAPLAENYTVFVHVVDKKGDVLAQRDNEPVTGFYPTTRWQIDEVIRDQYEIHFEDDAGAAAAGLRIGMYLPSTGERLPVVLSDGRVPDDRAVHVP